MCVSLQDIVLDFSPGPIQAVDGDRGLRSPISYAILSGPSRSRRLCSQRSAPTSLHHNSFLHLYSRFRRRRRAFPVGQRNGRDETRPRGQRQAEQPDAAPQHHGSFPTVRGGESHPCSSPAPSLCVLLGIPAGRPQKVHRCDGIGPSSGGEPFPSRV